MHNPSTIALPSPQVKAAENTALDEVLSTIRVSDMGGGESGDGRSSEGEGGVDAAAETTSIVSSVAAAADFHTNTMKKIEAAKAQVRPLACSPLACSQPLACMPLRCQRPLACTLHARTCRMHACIPRPPAAHFCMHARQGHP